MRIAVAGANGFVGSHLVPRLQRQHDVVAVDRQEYTGTCAAAVQGDLTDYDSFSDALDGVDAAYYLVHSMSSWGDFTSTERRCAENFARACTEHEVDRIIYLTGILPPGELSAHLESRRKVAEVLGGSAADLTELRASIILGEESASFRIMRQLVARLPVMVTPRWLQSHTQPIHISDAVQYLVQVLEHQETRGGWYDIGGPDVHSYLELLRILAEEMGKTQFFVPTPFLTPMLSSYWLAVFTDVPHPLARALVESLREDMVVGKPVPEAVEHDCRGYREAVRDIIG